MWANWHGRCCRRALVNRCHTLLTDLWLRGGNGSVGGDIKCLYAHAHKKLASHWWSQNSLAHQPLLFLSLLLYLLSQLYRLTSDRLLLLWQFYTHHDVLLPFRTGMCSINFLKKNAKTRLETFFKDDGKFGTTKWR